MNMMNNSPFRPLVVGFYDGLYSPKKFLDILCKSDLCVLRCRLEDEVLVNLVKFTGFLFARFSTSYGIQGGFSNRTPEEVGYAFDIPPDKEKVLLPFVYDPNIASATLRGNSKKVKKSVNEFNRRLSLSEPVIVTPYLDIAMEVSRSEQKERIESFISNFEFLRSYFLHVSANKIWDDYEG